MAKSARKRNPDDHADVVEIHGGRSKPEYVPPVGRAPRKPPEPVRIALRNGIRTLQEALAVWQSYCVLPTSGAQKYDIDVDGAMHVANTLAYHITNMERAKASLSKLIGE